MLWASGAVRLLDYGSGCRGLPILVLPSLVNRAYVLDLLEERSLLRHLAGWPTQEQPDARDLAAQRERAARLGASA